MVFGITIGRFVRIGAKFVAEVKTVRVGPEIWVDDGDVLFADSGRIVAMVFIKTFFERIIHSVDGSFAIFVASHSIKVGFLNEE